MEEKIAKITLQAGDTHFLLEVADELSRQKLGLGGRQSLPKNGGMLFVLSEPGKREVWMKGMLFAIDILWLGKEKRVLHIEHNVAPDTYPRKFYPDKPASFVIELSAGKAAEANISLGEKLVFEL